MSMSVFYMIMTEIFLTICIVLHVLVNFTRSGLTRYPDKEPSVSRSKVALFSHDSSNIVEFVRSFLQYSHSLRLPFVISILCCFLRLRQSSSTLSAKSLLGAVFKNCLLYLVYLQVYYLKNILNIFGSVRYVNEISGLFIVLLYNHPGLVLSSDKYNSFYFGKYYIPVQLLLFNMAAHNDPAAFLIYSFMLNRFSVPLCLIPASLCTSTPFAASSIGSSSTIKTTRKDS